MIEVFDLSRATDLDKQKLPIKTVNGVMPDENGNISVPVSTALDAYPVGSIYMSVNSTNPRQLFGGTWVALNEGRVLIGAGTAHPAGETGGEETHTLTTSEMPSHSHSGSTDSAGSHSHSGSATSSGGHKHSITYGTGDSDYSSMPQYGIYGTNTSTQYTSSAGSHSHSVSINSNGSHSHTVTINSTGSGSAHNNMQPYLSVYMWKRTA
jgi:microcystin-dependent protein